MYLYRLQVGVKETLERLRNASIKVWMLTGDKLETAYCIAKSSGLFSRSQKVHIFKHVTDRNQAHQELRAFGKKEDSALIINGDSLKVENHVLICKELCSSFYANFFRKFCAFIIKNS